MGSDANAAQLQTQLQQLQRDVELCGAQIGSLSRLALFYAAYAADDDADFGTATTIASAQERWMLPVLRATSAEGVHAVYAEWAKRASKLIGPDYFYARGHQPGHEHVLSLDEFIERARLKLAPELVLV